MIQTHNAEYQKIIKETMLNKRRRNVPYDPSFIFCCSSFMSSSMAFFHSRLMASEVSSSLISYTDILCDWVRTNATISSGVFPCVSGNTNNAKRNVQAKTTAKGKNEYGPKYAFMYGNTKLTIKLHIQLS